MSDRKFSAYVVLRDPEDAQQRTFKPGEVVPDWAIDQVGEHVLQGVTSSVETPEVAPTGDNAPIVDSTTTEVVTPAYEQTEDDDDEEEIPPYSEWSKTDLQAEAKGRELTGLSKATVEELVAALQADDEENAE